MGKHGWYKTNMISFNFTALEATLDNPDKLSSTVSKMSSSYLANLDTKCKLNSII